MSPEALIEPISNTLMHYTERSLAIACTRGREAIVRRFQGILADEGFTEQQWRVLRVLFDFEPVPLAELCQLTCIHKVSMTRIIRTLMKRGLVTRQKRDGDKRAYNITLTDQGRLKLKEMTPVANEIYAGITRDLGHEETLELLRLLKKLADINRP